MCVYTYGNDAILPPPPPHLTILLNKTNLRNSGEDGIVQPFLNNSVHVIFGLAAPNLREVVENETRVEFEVRLFYVTHCYIFLCV